MKTKRIIFTAMLALIAVSTAYAAINFSGGSVLQGQLFDIFNAPSLGGLQVVIEMPATDSEDYSYKQPVMFRARVGKAEGIETIDPENLTYVWESDRQGTIGGSFEFEQILSKGRHHITCTVTDKQGLRGTAARNINIINTDPAVIIRSPEVASVKFGQPVMLKAEVTDTEEAAIPDVAVSWKSNLDGEIGRGKSLLIENLSRGEHKITVSVRDSEDGETKSSTNLTVE